MKNLLWMVLLLIFCVPQAVFSAENTETIKFTEFQEILNTQCSKCHTRRRIEEAMEQGRPFLPIADQMRVHGVNLSQRERDVMGVFWMENTPTPKKLSTPQQKDDPLAEYRAVLETRCTGCHSLDRIEQAISENRSFEALAEMMLKRGAVLSEADRKVLGVFWGQPLR